MNKILRNKFTIAGLLVLSAGMIFYSCEKINDTVIDPSYFSPVISNPQRSTDTVRTTSASPLINFTTSVQVNLNNGAAIQNVKALFYMPDGSRMDSVALLDNGVAPDLTAGDGIYSGTVNITNISCLIVGNYALDYIAENTEGLFSNLISANVPVMNTANQPPIIVSTNLPDSVVRPPVGGTPFFLTISINATDPDGLCDLKEASFVTERPNGVMIPRIPMSYSGNGLYEFTNEVTNTGDPTSFGYYKYTFRVTDNSNVNSIEVKDSIKFVAP